MDDLAFLHERIESYADYTNDAACRLSDEQIRAYVGVMLVGVLERLAPAEVSGEALDRLLLRCEFADQAVIRALDDSPIDESELAAIRAADRELIALADRGASVDAAGLAAYLRDIDAVFDRRAAIIIGRGTVIPPAPSR